MLNPFFISLFIPLTQLLKFYLLLVKFMCTLPLCMCRSEDNIQKFYLTVWVSVIGLSGLVANLLLIELSL